MSYVQGPSGRVEVQGIEGFAIRGSRASAVSAATNANARGADVTVDIGTFTKGFFNPGGTLGDMRVHIPEPGKTVEQTIDNIIERLDDAGFSDSEIAVALNVLTESLNNAPSGQASTVHMYVSEG